MKKKKKNLPKVAWYIIISYAQCTWHMHFSLGEIALRFQIGLIQIMPTVFVNVSNACGFSSNGINLFFSFFFILANSKSILVIRFELLKSESNWKRCIQNAIWIIETVGHCAKIHSVTNTQHDDKVALSAPVCLFIIVELHSHLHTNTPIVSLFKWVDKCI